MENGTRVIPADILDKKVNDASSFSKGTRINLYYQVIFQKTQDMVQKRIPEAILNKPDQFASVDEFFAE